MLSYLRLALWAILWSIVWPIMKIVKKKGEHNCLTWAFNEWEEKEGYLVIRWCRSRRFRWIRWPHFLFLDQEHHDLLRHYMPNDVSKINKRLIPDLWFEGTERLGDPKTKRLDN